MEDMISLYLLIFCAGFTGIMGIGLALRATARLGLLMRTLDGMDWDALATLNADVQKLKRHAQRAVNTENGLKRAQQTQQLEQLADSVMASDLPAQPPARRGG